MRHRPSDGAFVLRQAAHSPIRPFVDSLIHFGRGMPRPTFADSFQCRSVSASCRVGVAVVTITPDTDQSAVLSVGLTMIA